MEDGVWDLGWGGVGSCNQRVSGLAPSEQCLVVFNCLLALRWPSEPCQLTGEEPHPERLRFVFKLVTRGSCSWVIIVIVLIPSGSTVELQLVFVWWGLFFGVV